MDPVFIAALVAVAIYIIVMALIPSHMLADRYEYTRQALARLKANQEDDYIVEADEDNKRKIGHETNPLVRAFLVMPGARRSLPLIYKAGIWPALDRYILAWLLLFLFLISILSFKLAVLALPVALIVSFLVARVTLSHLVNKRTHQFMEQFPDGLDMVVRGVKSGYPLQAAVSMIADHMPFPINEEFSRVKNEVAYGTPLIDALKRMADRIDNPDVHFLVVVLSVQQESGGNLAEVISNLSGLIRKRRQMRLKVRAMATEGKMSAYVLGALPFFFMGAIHFIAPNHMDPLFETAVGQNLLGVIAVVMVLGFLWMRSIVNIEI